MKASIRNVTVAGMRKILAARISLVSALESRRVEETWRVAAQILHTHLPILGVQPIWCLLIAHRTFPQLEFCLTPVTALLIREW